MHRQSVSAKAVGLDMFKKKKKFPCKKKNLLGMRETPLPRPTICMLWEIITAILD